MKTCLKVIITLFLWYLRDWLMPSVCHTFFIFHLCFKPHSLHPFLCASGFHFHPHSLNCYAFLPSHFHPPHLLSHLHSQLPLSQILTFPLSISLRDFPPLPPSLSPPAHTFFPRCVYPTQLPPHFPWKSASECSLL